MKFKVEASDAILDSIRVGTRQRGYSATGPIENIVKWLITKRVSCIRLELAASRTEGGFDIWIPDDDMRKLRSNALVLRGFSNKKTDEEFIEWCLSAYVPHYNGTIKVTKEG